MPKTRSTSRSAVTAGIRIAGDSLKGRASTKATDNEFESSGGCGLPPAVAPGDGRACADAAARGVDDGVEW